MLFSVIGTISFWRETSSVGCQMFLWGSLANRSIRCYLFQNVCKFLNLTSMYFVCVFVYMCVIDVYIHHSLNVEVRGKLGSLLFSSTMSVLGIELR